MVTYEACDVSLVMMAPGILASPGRLGNVNYLDDMNCIYNITLQGSCVSTSVSSIKLENIINQWAPNAEVKLTVFNP